MPMKRIAALLAVLVFSTGCYSLRPSRGGGQVKVPGVRYVEPRDVAVPEGYVVEKIAEGLTFPAGVTFDDDGAPVVVEAGYSYGEEILTPKLVRINADGSHQVVAEGERGLWTGASFHAGAFYVADGGVTHPGRILRITRDRKVEVLVDGLPTLGDHHTNGPAIRDGFVYFSTGTATNAAVVGTDNAEFGWLHREPAFHDIPCRDVQLTGRDFVTRNPLTPEDDEAKTGAFQPFGTAAPAHATIKGKVPCSGAVMRAPLQGGGEVQLVAWGFRNPFGLAFAPDGALYVTENGFDERGSRHIFGASDNLWRVEQDRWYGWPDYESGRPVDDAWHTPPKGEKPQPLIETDLGEVPQPSARFGVHSSSNAFDFSTSAAFGYVGEAFVAQFGDMAPAVGKTLSPVGFRVVRVDPETGVIHTFAMNEGGQGPASKLDTGGLERPTAARFNPAGDALYVVDFGVVAMSEKGPMPQEKTGVLWRIRKGRSLR